MPEPDRPFAVVDVGSNSVRLVVYERLDRAPLPLLNEKALCRLGRGLDATGLLDAEAMGQAVAALARFSRLARAMGAAELDIVATEAVRRARNGGAFLAEAGQAAGSAITVLSGEEEARTAAAGVTWSFHEPDGISADLGGGSVDLGGITPAGPEPPWGSLPLGTLPVSEAWATGRTAAERLIEERLAALPWLDGAARGRTFYVVGGGWRALARIRLAMTDNPLKVVHGYALTAQEASRLGRSIAGLDPAETLTLPGLPRRRLDTVPAAALLFARMVERLEPAQVVFSACGLREGRLFARLPPDLLARDALLHAAEALGATTSRMSGIGAALGAWTAPLFDGESPAERRTRLAACALADTAWREHPGARPHEAFFRLVQYPFLAVTHPERAFIAHAVFARYEGPAEDPFIRPFRGLLAEPERRRAERLGLALNLAFRVSGGIPDLLCRSQLTPADGELRLAIGEAAPEADQLRGRLRTLARQLGLDRSTILPG